MMTDDIDLSACRKANFDFVCVSVACNYAQRSDWNRNRENRDKAKISH